MNIDYNIRNFVEEVSNSIQKYQLSPTIAKYILLDIINQLNPMIDQSIAIYEQQLKEQQEKKEAETEQN